MTESEKRAIEHLKNPLKFSAWLWPDIRFYKEQRMVIESVVENDETFVPAGNMLG